MSEIKNSGLDQYGAEPFEQQHFETAGVEGVCVSDILGLNIIDLHTGCDSIGKCGRLSQLSWLLVRSII